MLEGEQDKKRIMKTFRVCTPRMVCKVSTEDGVIVRAAPILARFTGQKWDRLINWLLKQGKLTVVELDNGNWIELEGDEHYVSEHRYGCQKDL